MASWPYRVMTVRTFDIVQQHPRPSESTTAPQKSTLTVNALTGRVVWAIVLESPEGSNPVRNVETPVPWMGAMGLKAIAATRLGTSERGLESDSSLPLSRTEARFGTLRGFSPALEFLRAYRPGARHR